MVQTYKGKKIDSKIPGLTREGAPGHLPQNSRRKQEEVRRERRG